jgi:hypothetical protein
VLRPEEGGDTSFSRDVKNDIVKHWDKVDFFTSLENDISPPSSGRSTPDIDTESITNTETNTEDILAVKYTVFPLKVSQS